MFKPKELVLRSQTASLADFDLTEANPTRIIACPNPPKEAVQAGVAIAVPLAEFDVHQVVVPHLPAGFEPELISMSARIMSFLPRGLEQFSCPKVMKIGDTFHWGDGSLGGILNYCKLFDCDYHWVYQGVQHLHFLAEAGLKNVFWLPGTVVIDHYVPQRSTQKSYGVIFRGSESHLHLQRSRMLAYLRHRGIAIDVQSKPYLDCLEDYAKAQIVLNCSLNGDTNRRVYEVLMAGGFLLTDRLSPQSGLFELFEEGVHLECYGDLPELVEKVQFYTNHPDKAEQIAIAGQQRLLEHYHQQTTQQQLYRYIFNHEIVSPFRVEHDRRIPAKPSKPESLHQRVKVYELVQELHRLNDRLSLVYWRGENRELLADLADLPRLRLHYVHELEHLSEVQAWCNQVGIATQVQVRSSSEFNQRVNLVLVDAVGSAFEISQRLEAALPHLEDSALVLLVGKMNLQTKSLINLLLRQRSLVPICLGVKTNYQQDERLAEGCCIIYRKIDNSSNETCDSIRVHVISRRTQFRNQLKSISLVRRTNQLIRKLQVLHR